MKTAILSIVIAMMAGCIIQPRPYVVEEPYLIGTWCTDTNACYQFTKDSVYSGDGVILYSKSYTYDIVNSNDFGYYQDGVIYSDLFEQSFRDVYFSAKEDKLVLYLGGVLFSFDRVEL